MVGRIIKVSGALVVAENMKEAKLYDVVKVSSLGLIGEIIELREDKASIQVYENTEGLKVGDIVETTDAPLSVELGPGLIGNVFDGIGRSLTSIYQQYGERIKTGVKAQSLDHQKKWVFTALKNKGDEVKVGDILGVVKESEIIEYRLLVPKDMAGEIISIKTGEYTIDDVVAQIQTPNGIKDITLVSKWPIRIGRPYKQKLDVNIPLITGQRVIDTLFPMACGGVGAVPGPFGSGKTVVQHQLAKWSDADVVVYVGCGERGNEMTDILNEFPELIDPKTGKNLMQKTILIANTSDMPVSAREASIYTGITIAEFYRDMGYNVVIMADSTSRWAESLREMSGRLEEMPGEEGYPAYLGSRLANFYERAGRARLLGSDERVGSITAIGAVSPQGGDLSEPVSQATLRTVKVFWGLSASLAYKRHFPAIDWLISYSGYSRQLSKWFETNVSFDFVQNRNIIMKILQEEAELNDVVQMVGFDVLGDKDKITLDIAEMIREDFLHQNAYDEVDTYTSIEKQNLMLKVICEYAKLAYKAVENDIVYEQIVALESRSLIGRMKYTPEQQRDKIEDLIKSLRVEFANLQKGASI